MIFSTFYFPTQKNIVVFSEPWIRSNEAMWLTKSSTYFMFLFPKIKGYIGKKKIKHILWALLNYLLIHY